MEYKTELINNEELWMKSYNKALNYSNNKQWKEATYFFINALAKVPGHLKIINDYTNTVLEQVIIYKDNQQYEQGIKQLEWLEVFLHERISFVDADDMDDLLEIIKSVEIQKTYLFSKENETLNDAPDEERNNLIEKWRQFKDSKNLFNIFKNQENIEALISDASELYDFVTLELAEAPENGDVIKLRNETEKLQFLQKFNFLKMEIQNIFVLSNNQATKTAKAYLLQLAEGIIREMIVISSKLEKSY